MTIIIRKRMDPKEREFPMNLRLEEGKVPSQEGNLSSRMRFHMFLTTPQTTLENAPEAQTG